MTSQGCPGSELPGKELYREVTLGPYREKGWSVAAGQATVIIIELVLGFCFGGVVCWFPELNASGNCFKLFSGYPPQVRMERFYSDLYKWLTIQLRTSNV